MKKPDTALDAVTLEDPCLVGTSAMATGMSVRRALDDQLAGRRLKNADLARAVDRGELRVMYQPVVSLDDERGIKRR